MDMHYWNTSNVALLLYRVENSLKNNHFNSCYNKLNSWKKALKSRSLRSRNIGITQTFEVPWQMEKFRWSFWIEFVWLGNMYAKSLMAQKNRMDTGMI